MVLVDPNRIQSINKGTTANDGTGDTLRTAAEKINSNFSKLDSDFEDLTLVQLLTKEITEGDAKLDLTVLPVQTSSYVFFNNAFDSVGHLNATLDAGDSYSTYVSTIAYMRNTDRFLVSDSSKWERLLLDSDTFTLSDFPKFEATFKDDSNNEILQLARAGTSAANYVKITNSATGNDPSILAIGDDTNIDLVLDGKGSGVVSVTDGLTIGGNTTVGGTLSVTGASTFNDVTVENATFLNNVTINSDLTVTDKLLLNGYAVITPEDLTIAGGTTRYNLKDANVSRFSEDGDTTITIFGTGGGDLDGMSFSIIVNNNHASADINITLSSDSATIHHAVGNPVELSSGKYSIIGGIVFDSANIVISNANTVS